MIHLYLILFCVILAILFGKMINVDIPIEPKILARTGGAIEKDNFTYFYIHKQGPIIINLTSLIGDADLYISDKYMYPTYNPELYTLHSATCGEDIIEVPESFESPLAVGVYGHADSSFYMLEISENLNSAVPYKQWVSISRDLENFKETTKQEYKNTADNNKKGSSNQISKKKKNKSSSSIPTIFSVLEMLQLIFL